MRVLSLFDGMACAALALNKAAIPIEEYNAFEIDKYAIQTSSHNLPFIKHYGDVFGADFTQFKGCDILMGGSPCTYWSIAQKNNRETEASGLGWELFSQYVRALKEAEPRYFIYENNKSMSNAIRESISEAFGFTPIMINSALVSAQNRQRLYWVGRRNLRGGYDKVDVKLPEDRGILLRDILESGFCDREKAYALKHQAGNARDYLKKHHTQVAFEPVIINTPHGFNKGGVKQGKSPCLTANGSWAHNNHLCIPINATDSGKAQTIKGQYIKNGVPNFVGYKSTYGATGVAEPIRIGDIGTTAQAHMYQVVNGMITHNGKQYPIKLRDGCYIIRKLTVKECMRLQTVPEWYEFPVSDTQAYKMLGNGWTVDVIEWILRFIKECER